MGIRNRVSQRETLQKCINKMNQVGDRISEGKVEELKYPAMTKT